MSSTPSASITPPQPLVIIEKLLIPGVLASTLAVGSIGGQLRLAFACSLNVSLALVHITDVVDSGPLGPMTNTELGPFNLEGINQFDAPCPSRRRLQQLVVRRQLQASPTTSVSTTAVAALQIEVPVGLGVGFQQVLYYQEQAKLKTQLAALVTGSGPLLNALQAFAAAVGISASTIAAVAPASATSSPTSAPAASQSPPLSAAAAVGIAWALFTVVVVVIAVVYVRCRQKRHDAKIDPQSAPAARSPAAAAAVPEAVRRARRTPVKVPEGPWVPPRSPATPGGRRTAWRDRTNSVTTV